MGRDFPWFLIETTKPVVHTCTPADHGRIGQPRKGAAARTTQHRRRCAVSRQQEEAEQGRQGVRGLGAQADEGECVGQRAAHGQGTCAGQPGMHLRHVRWLLTPSVPYTPSAVLGVATSFHAFATLRAFRVPCCRECPRPPMAPYLVQHCDTGVHGGSRSRTAAHVFDHNDHQCPCCTCTLLKVRWST